MVLKNEPAIFLSVSHREKVIIEVFQIFLIIPTQIANSLKSNFTGEWGSFQNNTWPQIENSPKIQFGNNLKKMFGIYIFVLSAGM